MFSNAEGKCQRDFQAEVNADECHRFHESYELKWAGKRDADEYRNKVAKERRDNPDALIAKDKEILAVAEKLAKKDQSHAEIEIRLNRKRDRGMRSHWGPVALVGRTGAGRRSKSYTHSRRPEIYGILFT